MTRNELLSRISVDPNICFGKPCIKGHRIWVSLILDFLASGMTTQDLLREYPGLEEAGAGRYGVGPRHVSEILKEWHYRPLCFGLTATFLPWKNMLKERRSRGLG